MAFNPYFTKLVSVAEIPPVGQKLHFPSCYSQILVLRITPEFWEISLFVQWISLNLCAHPC